MLETGFGAGEESGIATPMAVGAKRSPGMEEVVARMKDLATNRGDAQRRSKKSRASLRSTFRELCSSVKVYGPNCLCAYHCSFLSLHDGMRQSCLLSAVLTCRFCEEMDPTWCWIGAQQSALHYPHLVLERCTAKCLALSADMV